MGFPKEYNILLHAKSDYGIRRVANLGNEFLFVKIVEYTFGGDFLILVKSIKNNNKIVVTLESDKDFKVLLV